MGLQLGKYGHLCTQKSIGDVAGKYRLQPEVAKRIATAARRDALGPEAAKV